MLFLGSTVGAWALAAAMPGPAHGPGQPMSDGFGGAR